MYSRFDLTIVRSSGGVVVKLLACEARGPGSIPGLATTISKIGYLLLPGAAVAEWLSSWLAEQENRGSIPGPRHLNFQRLVISCFQVEIWPKDRYINVNPQNNQSPASKLRYGWNIAIASNLNHKKNQTTIVRVKRPYTITIRYLASQAKLSCPSSEATPFAYTVLVVWV